MIEVSIEVKGGFISKTNILHQSRICIAHVHEIKSEIHSIHVVFVIQHLSMNER